jgi:four helix bundle protein
VKFANLVRHARLASLARASIVEGCARDREAEYLRFLNIAFGSLRELHYQLNVSKRLGLLPNVDSSLLEPLGRRNREGSEWLDSCLAR